MGVKFYRGADKPKKIRKRVSQTRSWFRTFKWVACKYHKQSLNTNQTFILFLILFIYIYCYPFIDHAHPLMVVGHPFKGGYPQSTGYLAHPDMKRFALNDSTLFVPPRPDSAITALTLGLAGNVAAQRVGFGDFFANYFAGRSFNVSDPKCNTMMEGMKRCYENHADANPTEQCAYYIQGFERMACGKQ